MKIPVSFSHKCVLNVPFSPTLLLPPKLNDGLASCYLQQKRLMDPLIAIHSGFTSLLSTLQPKFQSDYVNLLFKTLQYHWEDTVLENKTRIFMLAFEALHKLISMYFSNLALFSLSLSSNHSDLPSISGICHAPNYHGAFAQAVPSCLEHILLPCFYPSLAW